MALLLLSCIRLSSAQSSEKPNFIFILTDDLGWTGTSSMMDPRYPASRSDYHETPNIDRLGNEGMRFTNGYAPAAICSPSRRAIQYGQTPLREGDITFPERYDPHSHAWLTIPGMLKAADPSYRAAHYGKWDLRAGIFPEDLGYDESDGNTGNRNGDVMSDKSTKWTAVYLNNDPKRIETLTGRAVNFIERQVRDGNPFYLQVSHYATHVDFQTRENTYQKYLKKEKGEIHDHAAFAGMLENLDDGIGRILDEVEKLGISANTFIILMADNGGVEFIPPVRNRLDPPSKFSRKMRNYPLRGGKWVLYEGGIRVPFMVKGPGIPAGSYCNKAVTGCDILPTLAVLAGYPSPLPAYVDGGNIAPLFSDPENNTVKREHPELFFYRYNKGYPHEAVIRDDLKLIRFLKTGKSELYNISEDVGETNDLSEKMPAKVLELQHELDDYMKEVDAEAIRNSSGNEKKDNDDDD